MSKLAEWLIAILAAIFLGYLLIDWAGISVWLVVAVGLALIMVGILVGGKEA
jgi:hypothetical protein